MAQNYVVPIKGKVVSWPSNIYVTAHLKIQLLGMSAAKIKNWLSAQYAD